MSIAATGRFTQGLRALKRTFDLYDGLRSFVKTKLMEGYTIEMLMREVYQGKEALHSLINAA